jgi:hypothetical protein
MPLPASVAQEPRRSEHRQGDPNNEDQMGEIKVIFEGSMSITSKARKEPRVKDHLGSTHRAQKKDEVVRHGHNFQARRSSRNRTVSKELAHRDQATDRAAQDGQDADW